MNAGNDDPQRRDFERDERIALQLEAYLERLHQGDATLPADNAATEELSDLAPIVGDLHLLAGLVCAADGGMQAELPDGENLPDPQSPIRIGKYEVREMLGRGGQSACVLAWDDDLRRKVVLKLYHDVQPDRQEQVLEEGRNWAQVRSPYVAQCYGAEKHDGLPYLVIEFVDGQTLASLIQQGGLNEEELIRLATRVAEGLEAVHQCGLVHGDVKPSNIVVSRDGTPRLIDFGLSTSTAADGAGPQRVGGTAAYMAPEQAQGAGDHIDPRTDVFGLGAVFYEALCGKAPHAATTRQQSLALANSGTTPRLAAHQASPPVRQVCQRCLAPQPWRRYPTAGDLASALRDIENPRRFAGQLWRWRWPAAGAAAALLLAALWTVPQLFSGAAAPTGPTPGMRLVMRQAPTMLRRELRSEFPLDVEVIGGVADHDGLIHLRHGQEIRLLICASRDCQVGVWSWEEDMPVRLLPNWADSNPRISADQRLLVPSDAMIAKCRIEAVWTGKVEYLHVAAGTIAWLPDEADQEQEPYRRYLTSAQLAQLGSQLRGLQAVPRSPEGAVSETVIPYIVDPCAIAQAPISFVAAYCNGLPAKCLGLICHILHAS